MAIKKFHLKLSNINQRPEAEFERGLERTTQKRTRKKLLYLQSLISQAEPINELVINKKDDLDLVGLVDLELYLESTCLRN